MSRYGDPRSSGGNLAYRDPPRWDAGRFNDERERRTTEVDITRERFDEPYRSPPQQRRAPAPVYEEDRRYYQEEERYGPRGSRQERRYYEEEEIFDPRASQGQMVPFRPPPRAEAPPRPGLLRRQSSLDTFDRKPARRYQGYEEYRQAPPRQMIPVPPPPDPRRNRYEERDYQEEDYNDGVREYKEREWITRRVRNGSRSRDRGSVAEERESEENMEEKPFPRRGKTKMPKRLVHTRVLYDLGYPYYEEVNSTLLHKEGEKLTEKNDTTIIIEKALGPNHIDEIITMSKDYWAREPPTTNLIEAPPVIREERFFEEIKTVPLEQAPASVRDWDNLRSPSPKSHRSGRSHRSKSRKSQSRRSSSSSASGTIVERETIIEKKIREISPSRTSKSHKSRRHSSVDRETEIIERRVTEEADFDESSSVHIGPLALVVDRRKSRSERDIKEEIKRLEAERRALRRERDDTEVVKVERVRERSPDRGRGEIILAERDEVVEVRKDKRARPRSVAPSAGVIRAMMDTLT